MSQSTSTDINTAESGIAERHACAVQIVQQAAELAQQLFSDRDSLNIEVKGLQDWVSNADKSVEDQIRSALAEAFPNDGIIGEEHGTEQGSSGFVWVIDPIDGTTNFVTGTPGWCVVLACVYGERTVSGIIRDPLADETYTAMANSGASLNDKPIRVSTVSSLDEGTLGVGHSTRVPAAQSARLLSALLEHNGLFRRSGSGALDLAYVAAGRLIGYVEPHMNAWDCLAAMLIIEEAGGLLEPIDMQTMLHAGGRVIVGCPGVYEKIHALADTAYQA